MDRASTILEMPTPRVVAIALTVCGLALGQDSSPIPQLVLENEFVRVERVTIPPKRQFSREQKKDAVAVRLQEETAEFVPTGTKLSVENSSEKDATMLLVEINKHWDAEMRPCAYPMKCVRETRAGGEAIAWTTTLFTNGFVGVATHKVVRGATLTSSYYSAKGSDRIVVVPFTELDGNFGGADAELKPGQPYYSAATEAEITGKNAEARWLVVRMNTPSQ